MNLTVFRKLAMKLILSLVFFLSFFVAGAQDSTTIQPGQKGFGVTIDQVQPQFPGGDDSLQSFLKANLVYPFDAKVNRIQGRVYIGFMVDKTGNIINPKVLSSASKELDQEALRVVKLMPAWKPGTAGGSPVNVQYILPIDFITPALQEK
jgi:TonB family protein